MNTATREFEWLDKLSEPEIQESLTELIGKLPKIKEAMTAVENGVDFLREASQDPLVGEQWDRLTSALNVNEDTLKNLVALLDKLPFLVRMANLLEQSVGFVEAVMNDKQSVNDLTEGLKDNARVITDQVQKGYSLLRDVQARAVSNQQQQISIFTVLKWMREPSVQNILRYAQAFIQVLNENNRKA
ncbi:hypothetical protein [Ferviditalea candida]|uniref:DUF1641 domain-containing protein n=1 Tax=Ferviditalea candida TaxID=3108399 RepID=A0ABU5ZK65_9BACL|nr:hypothetical protein [Paenibacillaceae bacterium T2]